MTITLADKSMLLAVSASASRGVYDGFVALPTSLRDFSVSPGRDGAPFAKGPK